MWKATGIIRIGRNSSCGCTGAFHSGSEREACAGEPIFAADFGRLLLWKKAIKLCSSPLLCCKFSYILLKISHSNSVFDFL